MNAALPESVRQQRAGERAALLRMVIAVLLIGALVPWLANAYWIKTLTSSLALAIAAAGVALLYGQLGLVSLCQYALLGAGGWVALRILRTGCSGRSSSACSLRVSRRRPSAWSPGCRRCA